MIPGIGSAAHYTQPYIYDAPGYGLFLLAGIIGIIIIIWWSSRKNQ
jgi:hypothetical protein